MEHKKPACITGILQVLSEADTAGFEGTRWISRIALSQSQGMPPGQDRHGMDRIADVMMSGAYPGFIGNFVRIREYRRCTAPARQLRYECMEIRGLHRKGRFSCISSSFRVYGNFQVTQ